MTSHNKCPQKLSLWMIQDLQHPHSDSIWVAKFSHDGKLLATAGKDATLKIWQLCEDDSVTLFKKEPQWEMKEHAHDIIDISWHVASKMLLSCSFDQKVMLWSLEQGPDRRFSMSPLSVFEHPDVPSQICFFLVRDSKLSNYFVSGAIDGVLRVWSINKKSAPQ